MLCNCVGVHHGVCALSDVKCEACIVSGMWLVVDEDEWHLWLLPWLCHPHVCFFANHRKPHSLHIPTFCCKSQIWGHDDLVACCHALVGCLVTTPYQMPFQPLFSTLLASSTLLSSSVLLPLLLTWKTSSRRMGQLQQALHPLPSHFICCSWRGLQLCEVSMQPFFSFIIICVISFDLWNVLCCIILQLWRMSVVWYIWEPS